MNSYQYRNADVESVEYFSNTTQPNNSDDTDRESKKQTKTLFLALPLLVLLSVILYVAKTTGHVSSDNISGWNTLYLLYFYDNQFLKFLLDVSNLVVVSAATFVAPLNEISIFATNEYGHFSGPYPFFKDYPGSQLVEPYKKTTISVLGSRSKLSAYIFTWSFHGDSTVYTGQSVEITRTLPGVFSLEIDISRAKTGEHVATYQTSIIVK
jgi:hypothetical protein